MEPLRDPIRYARSWAQEGHRQLLGGGKAACVDREGIISTVNKMSQEMGSARFRSYVKSSSRVYLYDSHQELPCKGTREHHILGVPFGNRLQELRKPSLLN